MAVQQEMSNDVQRKARILRVKVVDNAQEGKPVVNVKMPIGLVKWGMKMGQAFSPQMKDVELDWEAINEVLASGELGKLVEVEDEAQHKTVEVWVE